MATILKGYPVDPTKLFFLGLTVNEYQPLNLNLNLFPVRPSYDNQTLQYVT